MVAVCVCGIPCHKCPLFVVGQSPMLPEKTYLLQKLMSAAVRHDGVGIEECMQLFIMFSDIQLF